MAKITLFCVFVTALSLSFTSELSSCSAFSTRPLQCSSTDASLSKAVIRQRNKYGKLLLSGSHSPECDDDDDAAAADVEPVYETVIKMDDGGSDLTDRFKYKVNALMGVFDPQTGVDDEQATGNILNALRKFPLRYTFNCVGKTNGDETEKEAYVNEIKSIVSSLSGDEEGVEILITPRGKNFTRITLDVTVDSVAIINSVYEALKNNEKTVMQY
jgi:hypothetical protein